MSVLDGSRRKLEIAPAWIAPCGLTGWDQNLKLRWEYVRIVQIAQRKINLSDGFHALRRYVASVLADTHKQSSKTIQRVLRHKNVTTTERYIQNINADLKSTMNLLSKSKIHADHTRKVKRGSNKNR